MSVFRRSRIASYLRCSRKLCSSTPVAVATPPGAERLVAGKWKPVVGLEVHLQINSKSKLFSAAPASSGGGVNQHVALFDAAIPGTLPTLNRRCVEAAVQTALALNCIEINNLSRFDRKHYFYADMPAGFQITQHRQPIARNGYLHFYQITPSSADAPASEPVRRVCRIHQIQLEQDSGKSIHDPIHMVSLIDLNRAGLGLLEIVFEPDISSGEEAASLVRELVALVKAIGVCSGRMDEGAMRVDANISVHEPGTPLGTRTEVKNINSVRSVSRAIEFEVERQVSCLQRGERIQNVTMSYNADSKSTVMMRDKEVVQDYRFFPEPNIPALNLQHAGICVESLRNSLPPLPGELRQSLMDKYKLDFVSCIVIVREDGFFDFFTEMMSYLPLDYAKRACFLLVTDVLGYMNEHSVELADTLLTPKHLADFAQMLEQRRVSFIRYIEVVKEMMRTGRHPGPIVEENNWSLLDDVQVLEALCEEAIRLYPKHLRRYQMSPKKRHLNPMLKHVRLASQNRADMRLVAQLLEKKIEQPEISFYDKFENAR